MNMIIPELKCGQIFSKAVYYFDTEKVNAPPTAPTSNEVSSYIVSECELSLKFMTLVECHDSRLASWSFMLIRRVGPQDSP